jgi:hypothetical protein
MIALGMFSIPALGGVAYAASHSVSDSPTPEVVIPAGAKVAPSVSDDPGQPNTTRSTPTPASVVSTTPTRRGGDDPATHDVGDDRGGVTTGNTVTSIDDTTSNTIDDHGGDDTTSNTIDDHGDDGATHDVGDDHGGNSGRSGR